MFTDPLTAIGVMSIPFLISNLGTFVGFILATYFAFRYTFSFYEGRPKPLSWTLIITGLCSLCVSEMIQFFLPYRINPTGIEIAIGLIAQNFGTLLIVVGCYLIWREVI